MGVCFNFQFIFVLDLSVSRLGDSEQNICDRGVDVEVLATIMARNSSMVITFVVNLQGQLSHCVR